jgi:hypothetical protein
MGVMDKVSAKLKDLLGQGKDTDKMKATVKDAGAHVKDAGEQVGDHLKDAATHIKDTLKGH